MQFFAMHLTHSITNSYIHNEIATFSATSVILFYSILFYSILFYSITALQCPALKYGVNFTAAIEAFAWALGNKTGMHSIINSILILKGSRDLSDKKL